MRKRDPPGGRDDQEEERSLQSSPEPDGWTVTKLDVCWTQGLSTGGECGQCWINGTALKPISGYPRRQKAGTEGKDQDDQEKVGHFPRPHRG